MRRPRLNSLSVRMTLLFGVMLAAIAAFMLMYFPARLSAQAESATRLRARVIGEVMASALAPAIEFGDAEHAATILGDLGDTPDIVFAVVNDEAGAPLASWRSPSPDLFLPSHVSATTDHTVGDLLVVSAPILGRGGGAGIIHLGLSLQSLRATRDQAHRDIGLITAVVFGLGLLACALLASLLTRPIHRLTATARAIARGDLPPRLIVPDGGDEVGQMAQAFDVMLQRLDAVNSQLIDASRHAGMAQVATGVLHNVGNVLTSVNVDVELLYERAKSTTVARLQRVVEMMGAEGEATEPSRRAATRQFLAAVATKLDEERRANLDELTTLRNHVDHVKRAVMMQNAYARVGGAIEEVDLRRMLDEAVAIACPDPERHGITLALRAAHDHRPALDHNRVLQILVNLIANGREALDGAAVRHLEVDAGVIEHEVTFVVRDSGSGVSAEHLPRLFGAGFTTKPTGHGFGLHSAAQAARVLGGTLTCDSAGAGAGATFTLVIPMAEARP